MFVCFTFVSSVLNLIYSGKLVLLYLYHIIILVYFTVGSTSSGSAFVIAPKLGTKTIFESISLWSWLLPPYFLIRFPARISHTFVLFKDITLTWINYLETWLRSDNTSCYYTSYVTSLFVVLLPLLLTSSAFTTETFFSFFTKQPNLMRR